MTVQERERRAHPGSAGVPRTVRDAPGPGARGLPDEPGAPGPPGVPGARGPRGARSAFERGLPLRGWSARSRWGFDAALECYWVELWPADDGPAVRVGTGHLLVTVPALARALAGAAGVGCDEAWLALTA